MSQTDPQCALNTSKVKSKSKSNASWPSLVTRLLHKPMEGYLQIDGEVIKTQAEVPVMWPKKLKIPLDPVQPESTLRVNPSPSLHPQSKIWILPTLFPLQSLSTIWVQSHHNYSPFSLSFQLPSCQHDAKKCPRLFCVSIPIKKGEQRGKQS